MKILVVGLGSIARKHINALRMIEPEVDIYALRSSSRSSDDSLSVSCLYSFDDVKKKSFDFAIISNPTSEHIKTIELLKELRIPLFIEKPLYHLLSIEETIDSIEKEGILTYVACNLRFLDSLCFVKKHIETNRNRINEVNSYCGSYLPEWRNGRDYKENYSAIPELGGGVHIDLIHEIDYIYWLFGMPINTKSFFSNKSSLNIRAWDYANYCLSYPGFNASIILNYYRRDTKRILELVCEKETICVDFLMNNVTINNKVVFESNKKISDTYRDQLSYFIDCVEKNKQTFNTIRDAYGVLQICLKS